MRSLSAKLIALLVTVMVVVFALLGYLNIRLHRQHLEQTTLAAAERVSDVIKRNSSYSMLHNDRDGLYRIITTMAAEPNAAAHQSPSRRHSATGMTPLARYSTIGSDDEATRSRTIGGGTTASMTRAMSVAVRNQPNQLLSGMP